ncbi:MAG TPA: class II aldolase/adducin family protein [Burkholderiales bacterium]
MEKLTAAQAARPAGMGEAEWALRLELAACYRVFAHLGWTELIFNHITVRVPGGERHYLINPFGLHYREVTASNLIKVGLDGAPAHETPHSVNRAGFVIHSAIHAARANVHCIMHTHTTAGMAVAQKEAGLTHDDFYGAQLWGGVAYHDFEGVTTRTEEQAALVQSLGEKNVLILRNHGLLVCEENIPAAFWLLWTLQRACEVQLAAASIPGPNRALSDEVRARCMHKEHQVVDPQNRVAQKIFDAMLRQAGITSYDMLV